MTENVKLLFVLTNSLQELRVRGFTGEEFRDNLLDIRKASLSTDLLESILDLSSARHLFVHLRFEMGAPEFLSEQVLVHLQLIRILVVISGLVSDLLLACVTLDSSLKSSFLVIKRLQD